MVLLKHFSGCPAPSLTLDGEVVVLMAGLVMPGCFFLWKCHQVPPLHGLADMEVFFWQSLQLGLLSDWRPI